MDLFTGKLLRGQLQCAAAAAGYTAATSHPGGTCTGLRHL